MEEENHRILEFARVQQQREEERMEKQKQQEEEMATVQRNVRKYIVSLLLTFFHVRLETYVITGRPDKICLKSWSSAFLIVKVDDHDFKELKKTLKHTLLFKSNH